MPVIDIQNLSKVHAADGLSVNAVNGVNLQIGAGEFTAIVGASGSGKTTLLNLIGGIDTPSGGEVLIGGRSIGRMSETERTAFRRDHIGFVFQNYNLLPVLTALENVEFVMELQGQPVTDRRNRAETLLRQIGLGDKLNVRPGKLSGGQQQRVAVARALAHRPQFVIADEPTANLDSKSTADLLTLMEQLNRQEGITFLFSTHDSRVMEKARRVIVFNDGMIQSDTDQ
ncbi:ABC transporter ATP-binding protein [Fibrella sp. HMF5335]|uniref:ABC transporter ATP-binding protein n=2 Tax=Fibrella rubiginis TaxID=2817060 RepID=A0A939K5C5_9BACT|nr:ABC transporter ATP-binding protein [Fibrella rubiginis]